jgi:type II secretory pathway predicted ATPase ExeA
MKAATAVETQMPLKTIHRHGATRAFKPIRLRAILHTHGISHVELAQAVKQSSGKPLSRPALSFLMNYGEWPQKTDPARIRVQIEQYLRDHDVPAGEIGTAWGTDEGAQVELNAPYLHGRHAPKKSGLDKEPLIDIPEKEMLSPTSKKHFSIFRDPFLEEIRGPEDIYLAADQRYIREAMYQTARNGGFVAVVGESGAGKSTLRHDLIDRVVREGQQVLFIQPRAIDKKKLTARMICEAILGDIAPNERTPQSLERLSRKVEHVLTQSYKAGNRHVLLIEESQDLEPKALKHLKRFYELQSGYQKLLAIILIGQPELGNLLDERKHFDLREVIRRCEIAELRPLDGNVREYLALKFERVGKKVEELFTEDAFTTIVQRLTHDSPRGKVSMVYPLVVNNLVTKALNLAANMGEPRISAEVVKEI